MKTTLEIEKEKRGIKGDVTIEEIAQKGSLLPGFYVDENKKVVEVIFCESISGGADYINDMPKTLSLTRLIENGEAFTATYILASECNYIK